MTSCCVLGLGYIGLPTAAVLAKYGHTVTGVDIDPNVVESVCSGEAHIFEPDLDQVLAAVVEADLLTAQTTPTLSDVFIIAVPTPFHFDKDSIPSPNTEYVISAASSISSVLRPGNLVILESTCPVGTTEQVASLLSSLSGLPIDQFHVAYCPERVLPGRILKELITNDRVIGGLTPSSSNLARAFYSTFCEGDLHLTSARTAELVKLSENSYRDVNIAFANELSLVCDSLDVNTSELIRLANYHPRVNILQPGCGVGGHCIAVDPWFIASAAPHCTPLIQTSRRVNDSKSQWVIDKVLTRVTLLTNQLDRTPRVGCLGLAFKPDIDDLRESPALLITNALINSRLDVLVCEPNLSAHPTIELHPIEHVMANADLLVLLVAHSLFRCLDFTNREVFDLCGLTA